MDEVHNLLRADSQYGRQLSRLRELLFEAKGMVLAGFTGTPILKEAWEGRRLLDVIKGKYFRTSLDEGFLSSFPMRPPGLFPASTPTGIPDSVLTPKLRERFVRKVALTPEALTRYDTRRRKGAQGARLQRYCNLSVHFGSLHDGKNGSKARVLSNMDTCAPKLHAIALAVAQNPVKALVLVARSSGLDALLDYLRNLSAASSEPFGVATMDELSSFNSPDNLRGERYRVMVADSIQCAEGVSFFAVRQVHLADVPASPSAFVQSVE